MTCCIAMENSLSHHALPLQWPNGFVTSYNIIPATLYLGISGGLNWSARFGRRMVEASYCNILVRTIRTVDSFQLCVVVKLSFAWWQCNAHNVTIKYKMYKLFQHPIYP